MAIPKKPIKDVEKFIEGARAEESNKEKREVVLQYEIKSKPKKFLLELPYDLWKKLKIMAAQRDIPLKEFILEILINYLKNVSSSSPKADIHE